LTSIVARSHARSHKGNNIQENRSAAVVTPSSAGVAIVEPLKLLRAKLEKPLTSLTRLTDGGPITSTQSICGWADNSQWAQHVFMTRHGCNFRRALTDAADCGRAEALRRAALQTANNFNDLSSDMLLLGSILALV
jgi:hypothetical protein